MLVFQSVLMRPVCACSAEIGDIAGVAEITIRQSYRLMYPKAIDLFPEDFKFETRVEDLPPS